MSCDESTETLMEALLAGANGYMVKGVFGSRLRRDVLRWLKINNGSDVTFDAYLGSRKLCPEQREVLEEFLEGGYPETKQLAYRMGKTENSINKRLARVRSRLGLENNNQLVNLLTVLSGFGARYGTAERGDG